MLPGTCLFSDGSDFYESIWFEILTVPIITGVKKWHDSRWLYLFLLTSACLDTDTPAAAYCAIIAEYDGRNKTPHLFQGTICMKLPSRCFSFER